VVGVDRTAGPGTGEALRRAGAGLVVRDLAELLTGAPAAGDAGAGRGALP
jgi:hypothetical protein